MERILDNIAAATAVIPPIPMTDGELLMQYARHGDEGAFATLVQKHGRLVWTVCWQVLRQHHEIEDAFQSTFFILAKRASSIRSCDSLCGWLYRVAYRTALRARLTANRRPITELVPDELGDIDDKLKAIEQHEQRAVLLEELHALPQQYQQALVLCYLEGKPRRRIAEELGCSLEAVKGRLARGRQVLRHRLIRRGVSLSLAMGAMAVPVKAASVAVTPQLVGLTTMGSAAWAAGSAKVSTTVSSQVIHLAHKGTIAMTISSFAKPLVLGVALLGAVSATLAVDSGDEEPTNSGAVRIDLQASADAEGEGEPASAGGVEGVELVVAEAEAPEASLSAGAITFVDEGKGQLKIVANPPQPPKNAMRVTAPADVRVNVPPHGFTAPPTPYYPVVQPVDIRLAEPVDLKLKLQVAALEIKVAHLQLESKKLEIAAFDAEGEEREQLLKESRKKLMMAEAEKLQMQIEQQEAQIKELQKVLKEQSESFKKQAEKFKYQAEGFGMQARTEAELAEAYAQKATEQAKAAAADQAAKAVVAKQRALAAAAQYAATVKQAAAQHAQTVLGEERLGLASPDATAALSLQPGDQIQIEAMGVRPDKPIYSVYTIEPMGSVALGAAYGRVKVSGMSVIDAEKAILEHLKKDFEAVQVQVTSAERPVPADRYTPTQNIPTDPPPAKKR